VENSEKLKIPCCSSLIAAGLTSAKDWVGGSSTLTITFGFVVIVAQKRRTLDSTLQTENGKKLENLTIIFPVSQFLMHNWTVLGTRERTFSCFGGNHTTPMVKHS